MATTKQEFIDLAAEIFEEFADFQQVCEIEKIGSANFASKTYAVATQNVTMIKIEKENKTFSTKDGQLSETGGVRFIGQKINFAWIPQADGANITDSVGIKYLIKQVIQDPAGATIILYCQDV